MVTVQLEITSNAPPTECCSYNLKLSRFSMQTKQSLIFVSKRYLRVNYCKKSLCCWINIPSYCNWHVLHLPAGQWM